MKNVNENTKRENESNTDLLKERLKERLIEGTKAFIEAQNFMSPIEEEEENITPVVEETPSQPQTQPQPVKEQNANTNMHNHHHECNCHNHTHETINKPASKPMGIAEQIMARQIEQGIQNSPLGGIAEQIMNRQINQGVQQNQQYYSQSQQPQIQQPVQIMNPYYMNDPNYHEIVKIGEQDKNNQRDMIQNDIENRRDNYINGLKERGIDKSDPELFNKEIENCKSQLLSYAESRYAEACKVIDNAVIRRYNEFYTSSMQQQPPMQQFPNPNPSMPYGQGMPFQQPPMQQFPNPNPSMPYGQGGQMPFFQQPIPPFPNIGNGPMLQQPVVPQQVFTAEQAAAVLQQQQPVYNTQAMNAPMSITEQPQDMNETINAFMKLTRNPATAAVPNSNLDQERIRQVMAVRQQEALEQQQQMMTPPQAPIFPQQPQQPMMTPPVFPQPPIPPVYPQQPMMTPPQAPIFPQQPMMNPQQPMQSPQAFNLYSQRLVAAPIYSNGGYSDIPEWEREEYEEAEKKRKMKMNANASILIHGLKMADEWTPEKEKEIWDKYGYKTQAQMKVEAEEAQMKLQQEARDRACGGYKYDENGYRYETHTLKCGIKDPETGELIILTPPPSTENGERILRYSRRDDEMIAYQSAHFWDPYYIEQMQAIEYQKNYRNMLNSNPLNKYSFEELTVGGKMGQYYKELERQERLQEEYTKRFKQSWDKNTWDNTLRNCGIDQKKNILNIDKCFFSNNELAKEVYAARKERLNDPLNFVISDELAEKLTDDYNDRKSAFMAKVNARALKSDVSVHPGEESFIPQEHPCPDIDDLLRREEEVYGKGGHLNYENFKRQALAEKQMTSMNPMLEDNVIDRIEITEGLPTIGGITPTKRTIEKFIPTEEEYNALMNSQFCLDENGNIVSC